MRGQLRNIEIAGTGRILEGHGNYFFIGRTAVGHFYYAYGAALYQSHGVNCFAAEHEHVQRVAVLGICARNKSIVGGVVGGGIKHAVKPKHAGFFVHFIFIFTAGRNLNYSGKIVFFNSVF